ncbi:DUF5331 domain-containing protein [Pannus brasiliensis CCIBt3594]|uniref:DUF5331 domain-containing protein n=1 Tax=Pannus brasiliensis CCIBt3594 TaxID=1427578 RepID=A0AAW9QPE0_9CHRO
MLSGDFKANVREIWLKYCQANSILIREINKTNFCKKTNDGGYRPLSMFILGVLSGLSPDLANLMPILLTLSPDSDHIIRSLGLDFDPEEELERRTEELAKIQDVEAVPLLAESTIDPDTEYLNQFRNSGV